jgi:hypothetical protein
MSFHVVCPRCQASYDLPDTLRGKRLRCKNCKETFSADLPPAGEVKETEEIPDALPAEPAGPVPTRQPDREAEPILDALPAEPAGPRSRDVTRPRESGPGRAPAEVYREEERRGTRRRYSGAGEDGPERRRRPRAWDEEDEDERRPKSGSSAGLVLVLAAVGGGVLLLAAIGGAAFWALSARPPAPPSGPPPVVSNQPAPNPPVPRPAQPAAWRVQPDPAPKSARLPTRVQQIPLPSTPAAVPVVFPATTASRVLLMGSTPTGPQVEVWDLTRMRRFSHFAGRLPVETPMTLSPDGVYVAGRAQGGTAVQVFTNSGAPVRIFPGNAPAYLAFATGTRLVIGRAAGEGRRYEQVDLAGGGPLPTIEVTHPVEADGEALSPGGRYLALLGNDRVSIYELSSGTLAGEIRLRPLSPAEREGLLVGLAFSPDGRQLAFLRSKKDEILVTRHDLVQNQPQGGVVLGADEVKKLGAARSMPGERLQWLPGRNAWMVHGTLCVEQASGRRVLVPGREDNTVAPAMPRVVDSRRIAVLSTNPPAPALTLQRLPAAELAGRPAPKAPPVEDVPIPPDPPPAKAVDWSGVETVELPDKGEAQGVAADPAPALKPTPRRGPFALEARANEVHDLLFPRERPRAVVVSSRQAAGGKRVVRVERVDLATGRRLGTVSLYGRTIQNPISMFAPACAVSPDGELFAQIDINGRRRVDVWSLKDGKHVVGFEAPGPVAAPAGRRGVRGRRGVPRGSPELREGRGAGGGGRLVRDVAFVDAEHLLVLSTPSHDSSNGQVVLWKVPEAKPLYRFGGTAMPWLTLSPGGKYLAADTATGYALLEARTGKVVGRLPYPKEEFPKAGMAGFNRDGTRFAVEISVFSAGGKLPGHRLVCWDLKTGEITHTLRVRMPLLRRGLQWFGDDLIFMGWNLFSLEHKRVVVRYSVPGALATSSPDGRLWYTAAANDNGPASLHARTLPDEAARKVTEALKEKKSVPHGADFVPLQGEK